MTFSIDIIGIINCVPSRPVGLFFVFCSMRKMRYGPMGFFFYCSTSCGHWENAAYQQETAGNKTAEHVCALRN